MTIDPLTSPPGPAVGNPPEEPPNIPEPVDPTCILTTTPRSSSRTTTSS